MATISENLIALNEAKQSIKTAIENKGQDLTGVPFTEYASKIESIESGGSAAEDLTEELTAQDTALTSLETAVDNLPEPKMDRLQWKCDNVKSLKREFEDYRGTGLEDLLVGLDTSKVTTMTYAFKGCTNLTTIPQFDTSSCTSMNEAFYNCIKLTLMPLLDLSNATELSSLHYGCTILQNAPQYNLEKTLYASRMFYGCKALTEIPSYNTKLVKNFEAFAANCFNLITIGGLDLISATNVTWLVDSCTNLTNLTLKNIKISLQIGSGTTWGTLLTDESLINTAKELWDLTGATSQKLTLSTPSNARLDAIYVKLIEATAEMIANDEYITNKKPCVVCESTDEGAMTLRDYVTSKNWTLK